MEVAAAEAGVGVDPTTVREECQGVLDQVLDACDLARPDVVTREGVRGGKGRHGRHTEALSRLLAEMQVVARAHPEGTW